MGWNKRQLVEQAYEEIGYASYAYDLDPEQLESAMRRLDAMMATWYSKGIKVGYPIPTDPQNSDLDEETYVPDYAAETIYQNLGVRLATGLGKVVPTELKATAKEGYKVLLGKAAMPHEMQFPGTLPRGAGNNPHSIDSPFIDTPDESPIKNGANGQLIFDGD